jgi:hypothetical protein
VVRRSPTAAQRQGGSQRTTTSRGAETCTEALASRRGRGRVGSHAVSVVMAVEGRLSRSCSRTKGAG